MKCLLVLMSKLRESARGQECQVRLPAICNFDSATTILAHLGGAGIGKKHADLHASFCCSSCHSVVDGAVNSKLSKEYIALSFLQGMVRTQIIWLKNGNVKI